MTSGTTLVTHVVLVQLSNVNIGAQGARFAAPLLLGCLQGLRAAITDSTKLIAQGHTLYLYTEPSPARACGIDELHAGACHGQIGRGGGSSSVCVALVLGGIKVGRKQLFVADVHVPPQDTACVLGSGTQELHRCNVAGPNVWKQNSRRRTRSVIEHPSRAGVRTAAACQPAVRS